MKVRLYRWLRAGLVLGSVAGCSEGAEPALDTNMMERDPSQGAAAGKDAASPPAKDPTKPVVNPTVDASVPVAKPATKDVAVPAPTLLASLAPAVDCGDLLTRIQNDAIAKLKMQVELAKKMPPGKAIPGGPVRADGTIGGGGLTGGLPQAANDSAAAPPPNAASPSAPGTGGAESGKGTGPVAASQTNKQVADVDEADFVKVVENGKGIFLLHGATLQKLKSWPAAETALVDKPLTIEGSPSEMFVTDAGKAVVFSTVWSYGDTPTKGPVPVGDAICAPDFCRGGGSSAVKITVADVSGAEPKLERELYYDGWYVSSRRYGGQGGDIVRAVVQANSKFNGLYQPQIQWYDAWGRPYDAANIASQLAEWEQRTTASIRNTKLSDWVPSAREVKAGKLVDIAPACDSYFVPEAGLAGYGLTHVLSVELADAQRPVGGVTIVGSASTVYSNAAHLVLAQPDYRTLDVDFGITGEQQTALHQFDLSGAATKYVASGWVFGQLPLHNPQFGIDAASDGTIRVATTGWVRSKKTAKPEEPDFWARSTENYVTTVRADGAKLTQLGKSEKLGHENESVQSARFVGNRAYVVTFRQTDPLIVVDVANPASLPVLGEIEIPGFSQYIHPLDDNHLVTLGQGTNRNVQLQLFDVTDPKKIAVTSTLAFGPNSYSEASNNHKAFTFFEGVLAVPVSNVWSGNGRSQYLSGLELARVDAKTGFTQLGFIDHGRLYANNGRGVSCGVCDANGCFDYACSYSPEVRRGHFVRGESATYVYSFSYAGVQVHDLASVGRSLATVGLPAPVQSSSGPWYPTTPPTLTPARDGGVATPVKP